MEIDIQYYQDGEMTKPRYNPTTREAHFILSNEIIVVCPYCQSGWIIITLGIKNCMVEKMAICNLGDAKRNFYCPYCGKDMTEIFRW